MRLIGISRNRITGEIVKPVEPVNGQDKRRLQRRRWQARPSLLIGNQGEKAPKWLSRPFQFWEDGRRWSRPGESPFISALTGAVRFAIFAECLYTTSGWVGPKSRRRTRDGGFIYALSADENSLALAAFALQAQSVFLPFQMPLPSPAATAFSRQRRQCV